MEYEERKKLYEQNNQIQGNEISQKHATTLLVTDHSIPASCISSVYMRPKCWCVFLVQCIWQREQSSCFFKWNELSGSTFFHIVVEPL